jgi:hypothetical protein
MAAAMVGGAQVRAAFEHLAVVELLRSTGRLRDPDAARCDALLQSTLSWARGRLDRARLQSRELYREKRMRLLDRGPMPEGRWRDRRPDDGL